mgnify:FL=1
MGVLSKMLFTRIADRGVITLQSGFNNLYGENPRDVHYWCEDRYGKVYDPSPLRDYDANRLGCPRVYLPWDNQQQRIEEYGEEAWKGFYKINPRLLDTPEQRQKFLEMMWRKNDYHAPMSCHLNAHTLALGRPDLKVVVGSYGYKIDNGLVDINWGA